MIWFTGFARNRRSSAKKLFLGLIALCGVSLALFVYLSYVNPFAAYFLLPPRFWELGVGCLLFLGLDRLSAKRNKSSVGKRVFQKNAQIALIFLLIAALFLPQQYHVFSTITVVSLSSLIICIVRPETSAYRILTSRTVVFVGTISYSLYLWHWSILSISRWTIGIHWWFVPIQVALMLLMAVISYHYVETPLRHSVWSAVRWQTIGYGLAAAAAAAGILIGLGVPLKGHLYAGTPNPLRERYEMNPSTAAACNIFEDKNASIEIAPKCGFDGHYGHSTIYLVGDSHIAQFHNAISSYARSRGNSFREVWGNGCLFPAMRLDTSSVNGGPYNYDVCYKSQKKIEQSLIDRVKKGDVVFIGNALYFHFSGSGSWADRVYVDMNGNSLSLDDAAERYSHHLREFAEALISKGSKVVVYLDSAQFPDLDDSAQFIELASNVGGIGDLCTTQWFRPFQMKGCSINSSVYLDKRNKHFGWLFGWADGINKFVWDGIDSTTCSNGVCRATHYADNSHFKEYYANYIFSLFMQTKGVGVSNSKFKT